jgi:hypothetical protein
MKHSVRFLLVALLLLAALPARAEFPEIRKYATVRSAAILTTSYVGSSSIAGQYQNQLVCLVSLTFDAAQTSAEVKFQFSNDDSTWFDEAERQSTTVTAASGLDEAIGLVYSKIYQVNDTSKLVLSAPFMAKYARVAIKGQGTLTSSSATISCYAGAI